MLGRTLGDIGKVTKNNEKYQESIIILNQVITLYPNFADAYYERAEIKELQQDMAGAYEDYLKAEKIEPGIIKNNVSAESLKQKLREAIENNRYLEIESLISLGAEINCVYKNDNTPLHIALSMGTPKIVELLINNGANVNAVTKNGYNSLMVACSRNDIDLVELLLKNNSNVNQKSRDGWTAILHASGNISLNSIFFQNNKIGLEMFQLLDNSKMYILKNNPEKIVLSLIKSGADVNQKNKFGNSALNEAIFSLNAGVIQCLLDNGANVGDTTDFGDTPLMKVSGITFDKYQKSIVNLLDRKLDDLGFRDESMVELRSKIKNTLLNNKSKPQNEQIKSFNLEILKIAKSLIQHGANIHAKNSVGASAIIVASGEGNSEIVDLLIKSGADVNDKYDTDRSALFVAANEGNTEVVKVLLQYGADVDSPLNDGETALMTAVWFGRVDIVKLLVSKGANLNAKKITPYNKDGETSILWAAHKFKNERDPRYLEIFEILHNAGAR
jgi:hypothetical protein